MATQSRIGILNHDGSVCSSYCNFDGGLNPAGVGRTLLTKYTNEDDIRDLIEPGGFSSIHDEEIKYYPEPEFRMKWSRDEDDYRQSQESYIYLFKDNEWYVSVRRSEFVRFADPKPITN